MTEEAATLAPMQLPPSPDTDMFVVIPQEYVKIIAQACYERIPSEIVSVINSALMVMRPLAYIRYHQEIKGDVLEIIGDILGEIVAEMEGKALSVSLDSQHRPNGWQITAADTATLAGCPIYFVPSDTTQLALNPGVTPGTLGDLRQDGVGQDMVHETPADVVNPAV